MGYIRTDYAVTDISSLSDITQIYRISEKEIEDLNRSINYLNNIINNYVRIEQEQLESFINNLNNIQNYLIKKNKSFYVKPNKGDNNYNIIKGFICFEE